MAPLRQKGKKKVKEEEQFLCHKIKREYEDDENGNRKELPLLRKDSLLIGVTEDNEGIYLTRQELKTHTAIIGKTGSGKTVLMGSMVQQAIRNGWRVVFIDLGLSI